MVINKAALRSHGGVQRGQAPSGGGLGVSPRFLKTSLGRVGGKKDAHVTATTLTPPTRTRRRINTRPATEQDAGPVGCGFHEPVISSNAVNPQGRFNNW